MTGTDGNKWITNIGNSWFRFLNYGSSQTQVLPQPYIEGNQIAVTFLLEVVLFTIKGSVSNDLFYKYLTSIVSA